MSRCLKVSVLAVALCVACGVPVFAVTTFLEAGGDATQGLEFYSSTSGTIAIATDQAHTGSRSIKLSTGNPATLAAAFTDAGVLADAGRRISFWFRFDAVPTSNNGGILGVYQSNGSTIVFSVLLSSAQQLRISPTGGTIITGTTALATNTWHHITVSYYVTSTSNYQTVVYLNGASEVVSNNTVSGTMTNVSTSRLSLRAGSALGVNINLWYDDIYVDDGASSSSQPDTGDIRVTSKRPLANGTLNEFTTQIGASGSGYGTGHAPQVNEQPLSTTNGWSIINAGSVATEEFTIEGVAVGDVDLTGLTLVDVSGWVYTSAALSETGQLVLNGSNTAIAITSTNTLFRAYAGSATYPAGTGTDIGLASDATVTTVRLYECGVLVAYRPHGSRLMLLGAG